VTPECSIHFFAIEGREDAQERLRTELAAELGVTADDLVIDTAEDGKPRLEAIAGQRDVRFNLSHSGKRAAIAIAEGVEVGVDIEQVKAGRTPEYLRDWCRREAYVKGRGTGLRGRPRQLDFEERWPAQWAVVDSGGRVEGWTVVDLDAGEGYVAALAADSEVDVSVSFDPALAEGS
jgi:4'-phosphopantetheinyl transferase